MSTEAARSPVALDGVGMSTLTSTRTLEHPDRGLIWRSDVLAAGVPVHFHALPDGRWLMLLARRWSAAVPGTEGPQDYDSYTESTDPSWVPLQTNANFGNASSAVELIPSNQSGSRVLTGAASRVDYLFTLSTLSEGDDSVGLVQDFHTTKFGTINLINEERTPTVAVGTEAVRFDAGCLVMDNHLVVAGTGQDSHQVYLARKFWSRIGYSAQHWEYLTGQGWSTRPEPVALMDADQPLTSHGPVGMARYRHRLFLSTVLTAEGNHTGRWYTTDDVARPWTVVGDPVPLGDAEGYLGGTAWPQEQLGSNINLESASTSAAFTYLASVKASVNGHGRIDNTWGTVSLDRRQ